MPSMSSTVLAQPTHSTLRILGTLVLVLLCLTGISIFAHDVSEADSLFIANLAGPAPVPYMYLGAKHMVTGYDHLLYLAGVIFFLVRLRDIALYVSLFTIGHSITLIAGVLTETNVNAHLIDAIIGLSVVYKAFENMGGFESLPLQPNTKVAVFVFGLFHGLGLATKLHELVPSDDGILTNLVSFNVGVECGQVYALCLLFLVFTTFRTRLLETRTSLVLNSCLMAGGFMLMGYQIVGFLLGAE